MNIVGGGSGICKLFFIIGDDCVRLTGWATVDLMSDIIFNLIFLKSTAPACNLVML